MNIQFDITAEQEAAARLILEKRQENDPTLTIEKLFRMEALYTLGLTRVQMAERKKQEAKERLEKLSEADLQEVSDLIESKTPPEAEPLAEVEPAPKKKTK